MYFKGKMGPPIQIAGGMNYARQLFFPKDNDLLKSNMNMLSGNYSNSVDVTT